MSQRVFLSLAPLRIFYPNIELEQFDLHIYVAIKMKEILVQVNHIEQQIMLLV